MYDCFMEKLIYQMFILGTGEKLDYALSKGLGGVIFFTKDIQSKEQFKSLVSEIKSHSIEPPFLSIDQEGGRVERTEHIHARYLSPRFAAERGDEFLAKQTEKIALELKDYGLNLNFAPCADVNTNPKNPIIGERAFSDNPQRVSECVKMVSEIYRKNGIIPCLKHFPGHGDADKDSHLTLPQINLAMNEMEKVHIKPFKDNINAEMIMVAHLHCNCFDKEVLPASLSKNAVGYLRGVLNYRGVVITDDMVMKGVQNFGAVDACIRALLAGVDMFIYREADKTTIEVIEGLIRKCENNEALKKRVLEANSRILELKRRFK